MRFVFFLLFVFSFLHGQDKSLWKAKNTATFTWNGTSFQGNQGTVFFEIGDEIQIEVMGPQTVVPRKFYYTIHTKKTRKESYLLFFTQTITTPGRNTGNTSRAPEIFSNFFPRIEMSFDPNHGIQPILLPLKQAKNVQISCYKGSLKVIGLNIPPGSPLDPDLNPTYSEVSEMENQANYMRSSGYYNSVCTERGSVSPGRIDGLIIQVTISGI
jgi:hypothetical protein